MSLPRKSGNVAGCGYPPPFSPKYRANKGLSDPFLLILLQISVHSRRSLHKPTVFPFLQTFPHPQRSKTYRGNPHRNLDDLRVPNFLSSQRSEAHTTQKTAAHHSENQSQPHLKSDGSFRGDQTQNYVADHVAGIHGSTLRR